jgi:hypothetical protein
MIRRGRKSSAEIMLAKRFAIASSEKKTANCSLQQKLQQAKHSFHF